jgi:hypothetical protein
MTWEGVLERGYIGHDPDLFCPADNIISDRQFQLRLAYG